MAILINYEDKRFGTIQNAYVKLIHYQGHKEKVFYSMQVYLNQEVCSKRDNNGNNDYYIHVYNDNFVLDLNNVDNIVMQCYQDFKNKHSDIYVNDV
jgi:hypothetical protein